MTKLNKFLVIPVVLALFALTLPGVASAQNAARLVISGVQDGTSTAEAGEDGVRMATFDFDVQGTTEEVRILRTPAVLSLSGGAEASDLSNCRVFNTAGAGNPLSSGTNIINNVIVGENTFLLDEPLVITNGGSARLAIECNISSSANVGSSYQFGINTANVVATLGASSVRILTVDLTGGTAVVFPNLPPTIPAPVIVPGMPSTGMGGDASSNFVLMGSLIALAALGLGYSRKAVR